MPERQVKIGSSVGLHARPAALFTQAAAKSKSTVTIGKVGGDAVDAKSILMVLTLGAGNGDDVVLTAEGPDADATLVELGDLLEQDLDAH